MERIVEQKRRYNLQQLPELSIWTIIHIEYTNIIN